MTKGKSFFGVGSKEKDEPADAEVNATAEPSPAPGEMPERTPRSAGGDKLAPPHGETNPETVGTTEVNPHNEAAAQRPATLPNNAYGDRIQGRPVGEIDKLSDADRMAHLRGWANDVRLGGPRSADWELFDRLVGEDPEKKRQQEVLAEQQRKVLAGEKPESEQNLTEEQRAKREADRLSGRNER
jgi:hypothetical protein